MKKRYLLALLPALLVIGGLSKAAVVASNKKKLNIIEEVDADDEMFLNQEIKFVNNFNPVENSAAPSIGLQSVHDTTNHTYSVRFIAAINLIDSDTDTPELEPEDLELNHAIWFRAMFNGSGENKGTPIKEYAHKESQTAYTKLSANNTVYTIDAYNSDHGTTYDYFVTYALKGIPESYANDYIVAGLLYGTGDYEDYKPYYDVSKAVATTVDCKTKFGYDASRNGSFAIKKIDSGYDQQKTFKDGNDGSRVLINGVGAGDEVLVIESRMIPKESATLFSVFGYEDSFGDYGYSRVGQSAFIKMPKDLNSNIVANVVGEKDNITGLEIIAEATPLVVAAKLNSTWFETLNSDPTYSLQVSVTFRVVNENNEHRYWGAQVLKMFPYDDEFETDTFATNIIVPKLWTTLALKVCVLDSRNYVVDEKSTSYYDNLPTHDGLKGYYIDIEDNTWKNLYNINFTIEPANYGGAEQVSGLGYTGGNVKVSASGYRKNTFVRWESANGTTLSSAATYTFAMPASTEMVNNEYPLTAVFEAPDPAITPVQNEEGIIEYGIYPQSVVKDATIVSALNAKTDPDNSFESYNYYLYDGSYYLKAEAKGTSERHPDDKLIFNDGSAIVPGTTYWFKVEPIRWKVFEPMAAGTDVERATSFSESCLDQSYYQRNEPNGWHDWDTSEFYYKIRAIERVATQWTDRDYEFTNWKPMWQLNYSHVNWDTDKYGKFNVTDYARAMGVSIIDVNGVDVAYSWYGNMNKVHHTYYNRSDTGLSYEINTCDQTYFGLRIHCCPYGSFTR